MSAAFDRLVASDREVQSLFDPGELAHVCDSLTTDPTAVVGGIRRYLIQPLGKVIECLYGGAMPSTLLDSAIKLKESAENICYMVELQSDRGVDHELSEILNTRWTAFVVQGSAYRTYHDLPKERAQKSKSARLERPGAKSPLADAIRAAMKSHKASGQSFKDFMQMWGLGHLDGLRVESDGHGKNYMVLDENGDLGSRTYTWGTLEKMYSKS